MLGNMVLFAHFYDLTKPIWGRKNILFVRRKLMGIALTCFPMNLVTVDTKQTSIHSRHGK